ncbi:hypothetical protein [Marinivivus vitaminiproducens]|uniref:hypothetical protein n=1 Tax=Marinivivus vitaminiproducens TaxID=3035935 RepID=UPI00279F1F9C|nr:hypothetical protein P4R82_21835 [Geminicoccaceae bacterium SCSIO 64248]
MNPQSQPGTEKPEHNSRLAPTELARMLRLLVDELIPGGEGWPSASDVGVHGLLSLRLFADGTPDLALKLAKALDWWKGGLDSDDAGARVRAVEGFEAADPDLFDRIYTAAVLAYYETPFVVEAIRQTGRPYAILPHVAGYPMAPFDAERDAPKHGRGRYIKTEEVRPVDVSGLDLDIARTERWGIER